MDNIENLNTIDLPVFKCLLFDDHLLFVQSLAVLMKKMAPGSDVQYFSSFEKLNYELQKKDCNFLFIDLNIPGVNTKEFISRCCKKYPSLIVIVISSTIEISKIKEYFKTGISGYLSKAINSYELKIALERTYKGFKYVSTDLSGVLANDLFAAEKDDLTSKEMEILQLIAAGYNVNKIADILHSSPFTIMSHRRKIMKKLNLHSAAMLVKYVYENKLN